MAQTTRQTTCYRCAGTGTYRWGAFINGVASHEGPCFACQGGGEFPPSQGRYARRRPAVDLTCPTCKRPGALTRMEAARHYQCRDCADREEGV